MKNGIIKLREKHPGSTIVLKMVSDPFCVWKENQSITLFPCYFRINKRHNHILLVDKDNDDVHGKYTEDI